MSISTKIEAFDKKYIPASGSKYQRPELTGSFVTENAHLMTQEEFAKMFNISHPTFLEHFGSIYNEALSNRKRKRRRQFDLLLEQLSPSEEYNHAHPLTKTSEFIKAFELWSKIYDGLGKVEVPKALENPLAALSSEELEATLNAMGYIKKPV